MSLPDASVTNASPLSIPEWRQFSADTPEAVPALIESRIAALPEAQRKAVFSSVCEAPTLLMKLKSALRCGGLLAGVPYALKDLFDIKGMPTRAGSAFLAEVFAPAQHNSAIVDALAARGAIAACKTQLHEFAYGLTGENPFYGNVDNPAAHGCTTGGSSSGSAAAVAAGIVPFGIGTDTGGSIRVPAAFCGLYGFRMTPRHAWIKDAFPLAPSCDTPGWFTRTRADMALLNHLLLNAAHSSLQRAPRGLYLGYGRLDPAIAELCQTEAADFCTAADPTSSEQLQNAFADGASSYSIITSIEAAKCHARWLDKHKERYSPEVWARIDRGRHWPSEAMLAAASAREFISSTLKSYFMTYDFLVLPAAPCAPLRHEECAAFDRTRMLELAAPASLAGLPVLTIPLHGRDNAPTGGLQILFPSCESPAIEWFLTQAPVSGL